MPETGLSDALRALLPPRTGVGEADPRKLYPLMPGESLPNAVPKRLAEFSAGRAAARAAMAELGLLAAGVSPVIAHGKDRAPVWPRGITGSITHSRAGCLAAVSTDLAGLGIDIELAEPLPPEMWDSILSPAEQEWARGNADPGLAATLVFSAKEAVYKVQYPKTGLIFGFDRLKLSFDADHFTARFTETTGCFAAGAEIHGRHARAAGHILTAAWI